MQTTEIYLTVLGTPSPRPRCPVLFGGLFLSCLGGWFLLKAMKKDLFQAFHLGLQMATFSFVSSNFLPVTCVCGHISPFYMDICHIGLGAQATLPWPHITYFVLKLPYIQQLSHSKLLSGRSLTYNLVVLGEHNSTYS